MSCHNHSGECCSDKQEGACGCSCLCGKINLILSLLAVLFFSFQIYIGLGDHGLLQAAYQQQETALADSSKLKKQFAGLVLGAKKLADEGDQNVAPIVEKLQGLGISIRPDEVPADASAAQKP